MCGHHCENDAAHHSYTAKNGLEGEKENVLPNCIECAVVGQKKYY